MIKFLCKNCGQKLSVQDQHSGKRVKCPKCGSVGVVPDNSEKIEFHCQNCGQRISVPQIHAGKKGKCPKCKNPVVVPSLKRSVPEPNELVPSAASGGAIPYDIDQRPAPRGENLDSMAGKYFNFSEVLSYGWNVMKANLWFFVGLGFVWLIITSIPDIIEIIAIIVVAPIAAHLNLSGPVLVVLVVLMKIVTTILGWIISIVLGIGLIKIALSFCDEQKPAIGTLFDVRDCFWRYVGTAILFGLIMSGIIVPYALAPRLLRAKHFPYLLPLIILFVIVIVFAVRFGIQFGLCSYFVIDKGLGPVQAFKASSRTTMGAKWQLLGFAILCGLINLLGLLCLVVGVFAAYPTVLVASALVYRQLVAQTPELAEFGIVIPSPEPDAAPLPNEQEF